jgi:arylsulfate sulfotransferase
MYLNQNLWTVLGNSAVLALACSLASAAPFTVRLMPGLPSPQPVGTVLALVGHVDNPAKGTHVFRYSVSVDSGPFHVIRDFSQQQEFVWAPALYEHDARVRITVRNNGTKETTDAELPFRIVSRVKSQRASVTPTTSPLVALFSAPPCPEGSQFRVEFQRQGTTESSRTSLEPCRGNRSSNVYVAGMYADSDYRMRSDIVSAGDSKTGEWVAFHTGLLDGRFPPVTIATPRTGGAAPAERLIIRSIASVSSDTWRAMASDLDGNVVWYLNSSSFLTRVLPGGRFLALGEGANSDNEMRRLQVLKEVDLLGNSIRETNISRVAEQLATRGIVSRCKKDGQQCVSGFHHDAIRLPNGHTLVLAGLERMFPDGAQGSQDPIDILGDLVLDLDEDFQVVWVWNSFDHMDVKRASLGDEKCKFGRGGGGCTPVFLAEQANGWLHSNSLHYVHGSGDVLISVPEQDWIIKIDYKDGKGSGNVLWRLGQDGDFTVKSSDPDPWFSFQHDARIETPGSNRLVVFDDGHRRQKKNKDAHNRGQVWELDENSHTATLVYNADVGAYAIAVGSAQRLSNGGYTFESGFINPGPSPYSQATETSPDGKIAYAQQLEGGITYRSYRVPDLYTAPHQ